MKPKVNRGNNMRGLLAYALGVGSEAGANKQAEIVGGNMSGSNIEELTQEFSIIQRLRPDIARPVWHCSLSLPLGERIPSRKWSEVIAAFMKLMKFPDATGHVGIRHQDTDYDHIHLAVCRVGLDGKVWAGRHEAFCAITAVQALEIKFGLTLTPGLNGKRPDVAPPTNGELNEQKRTGKVPLRLRLQAKLDQAVADNPTASTFVKRLQAEGVGVRVNLDKKGEINGISFELEGTAFKGSELGKNYAWPGLQKRGLSYVRERDYSVLANLGRGADQQVNNSEVNPAVVVDESLKPITGNTGESYSVVTVAASKNIDSFELLKPGSQVSMPDAGLVNIETHHAEVADPRVENPSVAAIEEISSESLPPRISSEVKAGSSAVTNDSQDAETTSIHKHAAEPTESVQIDMKMGSELVALPAIEEGDDNNSELDSGDIAMNDLLLQSAEDQLCVEAEDEDEQATLLELSVGAAADDVQTLETIQALGTKDTLLTEGEATIVQSRLLAADEPSFFAENVSVNKILIEESHEELVQIINQLDAVTEAAALEDKNIGTVPSVAAAPLGAPVEPVASHKIVMPDAKILSERLAKLADFDESSPPENTPKGLGM